MSPDVAERTARKLIEYAGIPPAELQSVPVERLLDAQARLAKDTGSLAKPGILVAPVVDGVTVPADTHGAAVEGA